MFIGEYKHLVHNSLCYTFWVKVFKNANASFVQSVMVVVVMSVLATRSYYKNLRFIYVTH